MCDCYQPVTIFWDIGEGRVKFPGIAPVTAGYQIDESDLSILIPLRPRCQFEKRGLVANKLLAVCNHLDSPYKFKQITDAICESCPLNLPRQYVPGVTHN